MRERKPSWLKVPLPQGEEFFRVHKLLRENRLKTICEEANCPNRPECFGRGMATFLILGKNCTRACRYCNVGFGKPDPVDEREPERIVETVRKLGLSYVVITSVTRDDLPDGGAHQFVACVECLRKGVPGCRIELLIPDFAGNMEALMEVVRSGPDVINHNLEVVPSLFPMVRPQGNYSRSLELIRCISEISEVRTKSGLMVGLGEEPEEILEVLQELLKINCRWVTIGQYQRPTKEHWPVRKYYHPHEFKALADKAKKMGFERVFAGPLVRSSYLAGEMKTRGEENGKYLYT